MLACSTLSSNETWHLLRSMTWAPCLVASMTNISRHVGGEWFYGPNHSHPYHRKLILVLSCTVCSGAERVQVLLFEGCESCTPTRICGSALLGHISGIWLRVLLDQDFLAWVRNGANYARRRAKRFNTHTHTLSLSLSLSLTCISIHEICRPAYALLAAVLGKLYFEN